MKRGIRGWLWVMTSGMQHRNQEYRVSVNSLKQRGIKYGGVFIVGYPTSYSTSIMISSTGHDVKRRLMNGLISHDPKEKSPDNQNNRHQTK